MSRWWTIGTEPRNGKRNDWEGMAQHKVGSSDVWALSALLETAYASRGGAPRELSCLAEARVEPRTDKEAVVRSNIERLSSLSRQAR